MNDFNESTARPDDNQGSENPKKVQGSKSKEYDGSVPPRVSPKLVGTLAGYSKGIERLQTRQDYLEHRYSELEQEYKSTNDLAIKDKIAAEKDKITTEAPKIGAARKELEEKLPSLEKENRVRLENVEFTPLKFSIQKQSESEVE